MSKSPTATAQTILKQYERLLGPGGIGEMDSRLITLATSHKELVEVLEEIDRFAKILMNGVLQTHPNHGPEIASALCKVFNAVERAKGESNG